MYLEYIFLFKYYIFSFCISLLLFCISFFLIYQINEVEKLSTYECGFSPFGDSRTKFEIKFYLVGILFIIFDLEIVYLFPWILVIMDNLNFISGLSMFIFILLLLLGFIYELINGALDW
jgi:NADH-quinone oxidoreductase subunit A